MKYTIMGFRQEKLVELGLDTMDATILRYFIDFKESKGMKVKIIDGQEYYWIFYGRVLSELPILNIKKSTVQSRFFKLRDAGVLTHQVIREGGTYSYFGIGEKYIDLITRSGNIEESNKKIEWALEKEGEDNNLNGVDKNIYDVDLNSHGIDSKSHGVVSNSHDVDLNSQGCQLKTITNNSSTKDSSTKYNYNVAFLEKGVFDIIEYLNLKATWTGT